MAFSIDDIALGVADALTGGMVSMSRGYPPGTLAAAATAEALGQTRMPPAAGGSATPSPLSDNAEQATRAGRDAGCDSSAAPPQATTGAVCCCPPYQIEGQFLLETMSGRVWRYNDAEAAFVPVPRRLSEFERGIVERQLDQSQNALDKQHEQLTSNLAKSAQTYQDLLNAVSLI